MNDHELQLLAKGDYLTWLDMSNVPRYLAQELVVARAELEKLRSPPAVKKAAELAASVWEALRSEGLTLDHPDRALAVATIEAAISEAVTAEWLVHQASERELRAELERLRAQVQGHADRIAAQSELLARRAEGRPVVVCLCGSTRFYEAFQRANYEETMAGRIVLSVGFYPHSAKPAHGQDVGCDDAQKKALDELHLKKIDMADEVLVLNCKRLFCPCCESWGGNVDPWPAAREGTHCRCPTPNVERPYIGDSTRREIEYARKTGKRVRWLHEPEGVGQDENCPSEKPR